MDNSCIFEGCDCVKNRHKYFIFEGCDWVGKSTLAMKLVLALQDSGLKSIYTKEPGSPLLDVCKELREIIINKHTKYFSNNDAAFSAIFGADSAIHMEYVVKPHIDKEVHVISDRSVLSDFAYRPYVTSVFRWENYNMCMKMNPFIFYVRADVDLLKKRMLERRDLNEFERRHVLGRITELCDNYEKFVIPLIENRCCVIDNSGSIEESFKLITNHLASHGIEVIK